MSLTVRVMGQPAPQGSKRHVGGGRMVESSKKVAPWRQSVIHDCALGDAYGMNIKSPVRVDLTFYLARPQSHYGKDGIVKATAPKVPGTRPDLDKLIRSTLDALTEARVWIDDSLVHELHARKQYTTAGPGALIRIETWEDQHGG